MHKYFLVLLATLAISSLAASPCPHHSSRHVFIDRVKESLTIINQSLFFWRQQGGYFRSGTMVIGAVPAANQKNLLNALDANIAELAFQMGKFYTQTNPNSVQTTLMTNLIRQYAAAEQKYEKDIMADSTSSSQSYEEWKTIGRQFAQALANNNSRADLQALQNALDRLITLQSQMIQKLASGNFSDALKDGQQALEFADEIGIYLGRAIVLQRHLLPPQNLNKIAPSPF